MKNILYPALTQSNFEKPNNFQSYVKASRACKTIVDEQDNIRKGRTYWSSAYWNDFVLPAQGQVKPYCGKWISYGCDNTRLHPKGMHYAEHEKKTCKTSHCPECHVSWINRQANRSTRRLMKFTENRNFNFRHIVLSPPKEKASRMSYEELKKWLNYAMKVANIKTCAVVFHPFRFLDKEKIQPYVSPHFHLMVYGKITNTTEFYNKTRWIIKNKGDLERDVDIFNCVRYMLSHAGVKKGTHAVRYLGDVSYRKLKVEKEPQNHHCPYCYQPLTIFFIRDSKKSHKPPIDYVGLWEKDNYSPYLPNEDSTKEKGVPFYELKKDSEDEYLEQRIYSFEDILLVKTVLPKRLEFKEQLRQIKKITSMNCEKINFPFPSMK